MVIEYDEVVAECLDTIASLSPLQGYGQVTWVAISALTRT